MNKEECIDIINPPYLSIRGNIICSRDDFEKYAIALQAENTKLKQEKQELIKWLKEEKVVDKEEDMQLARDEKNKQFIYGMLIAYKSVLERLGE